MDAAHDSSAPVLPASMRRHSSTDNESLSFRGDVFGLADDHGLGGRREACAAPNALGRRLFEQDLKGEVESASPAMIAGPTPYFAHTVGS